MPDETSRTIRSTGTDLLYVPKTQTKASEAAYVFMLLTCGTNFLNTWDQLNDAAIKSGLKTLLLEVTHQ